MSSRFSGIARVSVYKIYIVLVTKYCCRLVKAKYLSIWARLAYSCGHKNTSATNCLKVDMSKFMFSVFASLYSFTRFGVKCFKIAAGRACGVVRWSVYGWGGMMEVGVWKFLMPMKCTL